MSDPASSYRTYSLSPVKAKGSTVTTDVDVYRNGSAIDKDALSEVSDFASALQTLADAGVINESISDYGTGFTVVDKNRLVNVPFVIMEWRFNEGDFKNENGENVEFVSVAVVTKNGDKWVINDGGTGIAEQLRSVTRKRVEKKHGTPQNGLLVPAGLVRSDYTFVDAKGIEQPGTTYYLSESPTPTL